MISERPTLGENTRRPALLRCQEEIMGCIGGMFRRFVQGWLIAKVLGWIRGRGQSGGGGGRRSV